MEENNTNALEVQSPIVVDDNTFDLLECYRYVKHCALSPDHTTPIARYGKLMQGYIDGTSMCSRPEAYIDDAYRVAVVLDSNPLERNEGDVLSMYRLTLSMGVISIYLHGLDGTEMDTGKRGAAEKAADRYIKLR